MTGEFGGFTREHGSFPFENGGVITEHGSFPFDRILDFTGEGEEDGMYVMYDKDGTFSIGWGIGDG